jgi:indole-3-glycerol phosphate synthase/phosphoribosylanthranilate isomerase
MADVLMRIVNRKREEVARRLGGRPITAKPTKRSLHQALVRPGARFIMEVKRFSPSGHRGNHSVEGAALAYSPVADAISVLTDEPDFGGSLVDLRTVRELFNGPILAKDFIVDPAQVSEARAVGADAILIMMSVLDDRDVAKVRLEAARLNMDAIYEVHDEEELGRALAHGARVIGINNRNLKTLDIDVATTERLAGLVPSSIAVISESGIRSRADVDRLAGKVDAFLVGSSLMASNDIALAARSLVHGHVKICGLTNIDDVELVGKAGATHAGFILVPGTPRALDAPSAKSLATAARFLGLKSVGVFRDQPLDQVVAIGRAIGFDAIQLHGNEPATEIQAIRQALPDVEIWGLCPVNGEIPRQRHGCDRTLFDTMVGGQSGGTGLAFDWSKLKSRQDLSCAFLAGGIGPANARAAAGVGAFGLDIGSGVEEAPGHKDRAKVQALFEALRPVGRGAAR